MDKPTQNDPRIEWGFYAITPRIVRTKYKHLSHAEKWLYTCLRDLCGKRGTCFRTLRSLKEETDISIASLSTMIPRLHEAGLIHAQKKPSPRSGKEIWHISIVDIWQMNKDYCSEIEQSQNEVVQNLNETTEFVQSVNSVVQKTNKEAGDCSNSERGCSNFSDIRIYPENKDTKIYSEEESTYSEQSENATISVNAPTRTSSEQYVPDFGLHQPSIPHSEASCMAWRKLNGGGSCADYQHSLDMHNAAALVADTTSKQEMRGDNHQSESPQPDSDPHSRSGVQEANAGDRQIAPEVAPELSTSQGSSPQARAKVEPKHTPASQQKKAEEKSIPAAPECPSSDAEWKTTTCLQLFTFWRGKPLLAKHQLMKASQCAKALAENYTREQVEGVRLFMVERDSWWSLRPEAVDVCTVAENMHKKLAEMDRANGKARKAGPRKVIPTREQDPYSIAALLEEQNPGYHACKAEMEASLWTN